MSQFPWHDGRELTMRGAGRGTERAAKFTPAGSCRPTFHLSNGIRAANLASCSMFDTANQKPRTLKWRFDESTHQATRTDPVWLGRTALSLRFETSIAHRGPPTRATDET